MDPDERRQKAITPNHLRHMWREACYPNGDSQKADTSSYTACTADLAIGAYFFAMRSCEYLTVKQRGKTKLLTVGNVVLKRHDHTRSTISPCDPNFLCNTKFVSITFVAQKNAKKNQTRTQSRTNNPILCPVWAWGCIIWRILFYSPTAPSDTPVNWWYNPQANSQTQTPPTPSFIRAEDLLNQLRSSCTTGGRLPMFGYRPQDIGTHSLQSGAAMALFLAQHLILKVMILGRWSLAGFVKSIHPQVMEWTAGMSMSMLQSPNFHHTNPAIQPTPDLDSLQANLDAAIKTPEETLFNGFTIHKFVSNSVLNLEF